MRTIDLEGSFAILFEEYGYKNAMGALFELVYYNEYGVLPELAQFFDEIIWEDNNYIIVYKDYGNETL